MADGQPPGSVEGRSRGAGVVTRPGATAADTESVGTPGNRADPVAAGPVDRL
jgi:hypothetical protein